uniref:Uncharacterized protein n=1 Tax=Romanomermis culicivorax TaxID=13658 RepID=A0A915HU53_ROMCU
GIFWYPEKFWETWYPHTTHLRFTSLPSGRTFYSGKDDLAKMTKKMLTSFVKYIAESAMRKKYLYACFEI